jgi:predicted nucleic acid-binding protein
MGAFPAGLGQCPSRSRISRCGDRPADSGERAAIALAERLTANLLLIDERRGVRVAMSKGFDVTGTLGILDRAARRGLIDLADCVQRLKGTNFRYSPEILSRLLK